MPQCVHRARDCDLHTLPLTMHYGGEKMAKKWSDYDPQQTRSYFWGSRLLCKFSSKLSENCDLTRAYVSTHQHAVTPALPTQHATTTDRYVSDRHTDAGGFIICSMLCYSNGTDNKHCYHCSYYNYLDYITV